MVIGPTPPGTGVIALAFSATGVEIHVAVEDGLAALGLADPVDAHVDDHRALLDHVRADHPRPAGGDDEDIGPPGVGGHVAGAGVADGDRGVAAGPLLQHQVGHRLADDVRAADHHHLGAVGLHPGPLQQFEDAVRGAGQEAGLAEQHLAHVHRVEAVHVLGRVDGEQHLGLVDVARQGQLHEDAVDGRVLVVPVDAGKQFRLGGVRRQGHLLGVDAEGVGGAVLGRHVRLGGRVLAHQDRHQAGNEVVLLFEAGDLGGEFSADGAGGFSTADDLCGHVSNNRQCVGLIKWLHGLHKATQ